MDAVYDVTHTFHYWLGTIEVSLQLGADTFLLLGNVQPSGITPVVLMFIYGAVIIVPLLVVATQLQMLTGKLVDPFHLLT